MKESSASIIGFLVAPVVPGLMFGVLTPVTPKGTNFLTVLGLLPIGYGFSALATLVFAVPAFLILRRLKLIRLWSAVLTGFVIGAFISAAMQWPNFRGQPNAPADVLIFGLAGGASAMIFWLIWRRGRAI